jgi:hypothetical protein
VSPSLKWTRSKSGLLLSRRTLCDGEVESVEQLVRGLSVAADEHGQAVGSVRGGCDAAYRFDDADGDVGVVDQVCDVRKGPMDRRATLT